MRVPPQVQGFRAGSPEAVKPAVRKCRKLGVDSNELFGMRVGKWLEEHGVHHRENPGGGPDSQHQAQHRRSREAQILAHHSNGKLDVLPKRFHRSSPRGRYGRGLTYVPDNWELRRAIRTNVRTWRACASSYPVSTRGELAAPSYIHLPPWRPALSNKSRRLEILRRSRIC
jgi:hypothetical protein